MAKKPTIPGVQPVRPMDPEWRIKFKSLKELGSEKRYSRPSHKSNSQRKLNRDENA
jgi:hypothetical protein